MKLEINNKKYYYFFFFKKGVKQNAYFWKLKTTLLNNSWQENETIEILVYLEL